MLESDIHALLPIPWRFMRADFSIYICCNCVINIWTIKVLSDFINIHSLMNAVCDLHAEKSALGKLLIVLSRPLSECRTDEVHTLFIWDRFDISFDWCRKLSFGFYIFAIHTVFLLLIVFVYAEGICGRVLPILRRPWNMLWCNLRMFTCLLSRRVNRSSSFPLKLILTTIRLQKNKKCLHLMKWRLHWGQCFGIETIITFTRLTSWLNISFFIVFLLHLTVLVNWSWDRGCDTK